MGVFIGALKIIFVLGFLVLIHESGHFFVAKACKVKVREFSIGFGPKIFEKAGKETKYTLRLIPFGGFVDMLGEAERKDEEGSFSNSPVWKRFLIVIAGATVNIIFGFIVYFILMVIYTHKISTAFIGTIDYLKAIGQSLVSLFTGGVKMDQMMGPIGISEVIVKTKGLAQFIYFLSVISLSLGVTNLLPIPALDGGKLLLLIIEWIRRKPLKEEIEIKIQMLGFSFLILLSLYISFNDIIRIF